MHLDLMRISGILESIFVLLARISFSLVIVGSNKQWVYRSRHTLLLVDGSPRIVVVGRGGLDGCLRALGQISELDHVASIHQLLVSLLDLVLDVVLLGTLGVVDTEDLIEVIGSTMLFGQKKSTGSLAKGGLTHTFSCSRFT
jgi:hypothetical protein